MSVPEMQQSPDRIAEKLRTYAQNVLVLVFGFLPIFFIPDILAPFEYSKVFFVLVGIAVALVLYSLSVLRSGSVRIGVSYTLVTLWVVAGMTLLSSVFSGDMRDSFMGDILSIHSSFFLVILALIASVWVVLDVKKASVMRLYILLAASTLTLVVFHIVRLMLGSDTLTFGVFLNATATLVGSWNDLALFLGLSVILALVALEQLPLTKTGRILFGVVTACALGMLGVINFFTVWLVLGLTSLAIVVYSLSKDRFNGGQLTLVPNKSLNMTSLIASLCVFVISVLFVIGGSVIGAAISKHTGISYIEVRPSLEATANIARGVYDHNAFLGIGANKFVDAWRLYKEQSINTTLFWNTDFMAGNGYITTFFVTTGVLGGLAWIVFLLVFVGSGIKMLFTAGDTDRMWYFIGVSSFVSAVYIWGMSLIYVPGAVVLMLGALCTGISLAAAKSLMTTSTRSISFITNRRMGFVLTLAVVIVIVGTVSSLYGVGRHYAAAYTFNESISTLQRGGSIDDAELLAAKAYGFGTSDTYMRRVAEFQLARINAMLALTSPTVEDQRRFSDTIAKGVDLALETTGKDPSESANWALLGGMYSVLMGAQMEGVYDRAFEALSKARDLNPKNPITYLELAILDVRAGKYDTARKSAEQAIALKPDFTEAFFYLSQIDIVTGNVEGAIASTLSIISLEPQNPARYYQLGVLYTAQGNVDGAIASFERAVELDQNYANARYFLALAYDAKGLPDKAKSELRKVQELNPDNVDITEMLRKLDIGERLTGTAQTSVDSQSVMTDGAGVQVENGTVTTQGKTDTPLVAPVNTVPTESSRSSQSENEPVE